MKNYLKSRLLNNAKVLKVLLNFLKATKMRCFKKKVNMIIIKVWMNDKWGLIKLKKKKYKKKYYK